MLGVDWEYELNSSLFPVVQRCQLNSDAAGKALLGQASGLTNLLHRQRIHMKLAGRRSLSFYDLIHLLHAFQQFVEEYTDGVTSTVQ